MLYELARVDGVSHSLRFLGEGSTIDVAMSLGVPRLEWLHLFDGIWITDLLFTAFQWHVCTLEGYLNR